MLVLALAGAGAFVFLTPITIAIATLLTMVVISYRQTIRAYPGGGGAFIVANENLGLWAGVIAAAALLTDYTLTVAVSVSAGVAAITSALPRSCWTPRRRSPSDSWSWSPSPTCGGRRSLRSCSRCLPMPSWPRFSP